MARVQTEKRVNNNKKEVKSTKGQLALQIAVGAVLVALIVFIVIIMVKLLNPTTEETDETYDRFATVDVADLSLIVNIAIDESGDYNNIKSEKARNLLLSDGEKNIYILLYSKNSSDYGDDSDSKKEALKNAVANVKEDSSGDFLFLILEYSENDTVFKDVFEGILRNNGISNVPSVQNQKVPMLMRILYNPETEAKTFGFVTSIDRITSFLR